MYKLFSYLAIAVFCISTICRVYAAEPQSTKLMATYTKLTDGTKRIKATLLAIEEKGKSPVENATLQVSSMDGDNPVLLGTIATNWKGIAFLNIPESTQLIKDKDGNFNLMVEYKGDNKYSASRSSLTVKDVHLDLIIDEQDTAKNVKALLYETDDKGLKKMIPATDVEFDVKRLFCNYGFATVKTDSSGSSSAVFPARMPGDSTGNVIVLARLVDNDTYATVESSRKVKWGTPVIPVVTPKRGLGDTDAPLWMVYTLIVLLSAVWLHFMYIIYSILRINYLGIKMLKKKSALAT